MIPQETKLLGGSLDSAFDFIDECRTAGGVVLVHCNAGCSRAPAAVMVSWNCMHSLSTHLCGRTCILSLCASFVTVVFFLPSHKQESAIASRAEDKSTILWCLFIHRRVLCLRHTRTQYMIVFATCWQVTCQHLTSCSYIQAYLMVREGLSYEAARDAVLSVRPGARPNEGFVAELRSSSTHATTVAHKT